MSSCNYYFLQGYNPELGLPILSINEGLMLQSTTVPGFYRSGDSLLASTGRDVIDLSEPIQKVVELDTQVTATDRHGHGYSDEQIQEVIDGLVEGYVFTAGSMAIISAHRWYNAENRDHEELIESLDLPFIDGASVLRIGEVLEDKTTYGAPEIDISANTNPPRRKLSNAVNSDASKYYEANNLYGTLDAYSSYLYSDRYEAASASVAELSLEGFYYGVTNAIGMYAQNFEQRTLNGIRQATSQA